LKTPPEADGLPFGGGLGHSLDFARLAGFIVGLAAVGLKTLPRREHLTRSRWLSRAQTSLVPAAA
jgi:hypothetical protein